MIIIQVFQTVTAFMTQGISPYDTEAMMELAMSMQDSSLIPALLVTGLTTIAVVIYVRFIEKRSLYSMGFNKKTALSQYFSGMLVGFVMFGASVVIAWASGSLQFNGFVLGGRIGLLLCFFVGFLIQGMSEEVFLRSYFMMSVAAKKSILLAVISNSVIFACLHLLNPGITVLSVVNLILFGLFASVYTLKMNSIWGVCAIHSIWNFAQGNLFGIKVSGMETEVSVVSFLPGATGSLINGGSFGLEGGLAVTIVLIISTLIVLKLPGKEIVQIAAVNEEPQAPPLAG